MTSEALPTVESLLAHEGWVRALVRGMVARSDVEDVVQETWVRAIEAGPRDPCGWPGWLRTVARRVAARRRRTDARRAARERVAARGELVEASDALVQRVELQEQLTRMVLELDEPFRTALLERYYEGWSTEAIARRHGIAPATVRTRLHRAQEKLRARLERRTGGPRGAAAFLGALAAYPPRATWQVWLMSTQKKLLCTAAALVVGVTGLWWVTGGSPPPMDPVTPAPVAAAAEEAVESADSQSESGAASRTEVAHAPEATSSEPSAVQLPISGRVLDERGVAVPGVEIVLAPSNDFEGEHGALDRSPLPAEAVRWPRVGESDALGVFSGVVPREQGRLVPAAGYVALRPWRVSAGRSGCMVVVARAVGVAGRVMGEDGLPLAGVEIAVFCERLPGFPHELDNNPRPEFRGGRTDAEGYFSLARVPGCSAVNLTFSRDGYHDARVVCPTHDRPDLLVTMRPREADAARLVTGRVLDPRGERVAGATVGFGETTTVTGEDGEYRLALPILTGDEVLFATKAGYLSAVRSDLGTVLGAAREARVDLSLREATGVIEGVVRRADGEPWPDLQVYLWDLGYLGSSHHTVEGFAVGDDDEWIGPSAHTDETGRFALSGLDERAYRLRLLDRSVGFAWTTAPVVTGTPRLEIVVPRSAVRGQLSGRVVDLSDRGVAGVRLSYRIDIRMREGEGVFDMGGEVTTAEDGSFSLSGVPRDEALLMLSGAGITPTSYRVPAEHPDAGVRIVVERSCPFRVSAPTHPDARFQVIDEAGRPLGVMQRTGGGRITNTDWRLTGGTTEVLRVSERARTVVLRDADGNELGRRPIVVRPGIAADVRF